MLHIDHEPIETHGLVDGCKDCDWIAGHPFTAMSDAELGALIDRNEQGLDPRSTNEQRAMVLVYNAQERLRLLESREYQAASEAEGKRVLGND